MNSLEDIQLNDEIMKYAAPNFLTQQPFLHSQYKLRHPHKLPPVVSESPCEVTPGLAEMPLTSGAPGGSSPRVCPL